MILFEVVTVKLNKGTMDGIVIQIQGTLNFTSLTIVTVDISSIVLIRRTVMILVQNSI